MNKFVSAYNKFASNRDSLVEDCQLMIETLDNTTELEKEIERLSVKSSDILVLVKNLIDKNCNEVLNQDKFQKEYNSYDKEHKNLLD